MRSTNQAGHDDHTLAQRLARQLVSVTARDVGPDAAAKVATCLFDLIGCVFEAADKPVSRQALAAVMTLAQRHDGSAVLIGHGRHAAAAEAAFVNAVAGHGLVREDMHAGSVSHLGVAVLPALLALANVAVAQGQRIDGRGLVAAAVVGYEVGARIGRALITPELARVHRPTGITGPLAAAAAGARLLGLDAAQAASALALAANATGGFNQWGHSGGCEMYVHPGQAARSGVTAVLLARAGAWASPDALDGVAGLFASLQRGDAASAVRLFDGPPEILAVYHKPV
ncbi:MAG: MmgE/PrpD family protein, partial [Rubrivivax sp.]